MTTTTMEQAEGEGSNMYHHGITGKAITNYKGRTRRTDDTVYNLYLLSFIHNSMLQSKNYAISTKATCFDPMGSSSGL